MKVHRLRISGFRGISSADIILSNHTIFAGPNNCGKTTVIEAMARVLGRDRLLRDMTEHDFFGSSPSPADRLSIIATITDFPGNTPHRNVDWFRPERAVEKWLDPKTGTLHPEQAEGRTLACEIGVAARFVQEALEVETIRYFHDDDEMEDAFAHEGIKAVPARLIQEIGFFLVPANRTWDRTLSFGSELFRRIVASVGGKPAIAVLKERERLRSPELPLEKDIGLSAMIGDVEAELSGILGRPANIRLRLTTTDSEGVLDAVIPHYFTNEQHQIPARRQGSGLVSLQHLLLLLHFGRIRSAERKSFIMAVEEPELHVPPPMQRRMIHRIRSLSTQTIVATHSPGVAVAGDPTAIQVISNKNGVLSSNPLASAPLTQSDPNWKRVLYGLRRQETITALMHDTVLVPEGRIDHDILAMLLRSEELRRSHIAMPSSLSQFGTSVGVIPTTDANVVGVYSELSRIHDRVLCIVDGDTAGTQYIGKLTKLTSPPKRILQLPENWAIEDALAWIVLADESTAIKEVSSALSQTILSVADLTAYLKKETRSSGWKGDLVVYEAIVEALANNEKCLERIRHILKYFAEGCGDLSKVPDGWLLQPKLSTKSTNVIRLSL